MINQISRWQLNRLGILNFWYYDEQVFTLEGGRLLFRGANGTGKSVTMQSFLPLVLDGDTRPSRLDPFGSRDRKIEYYLLGEDGEHTDRTGYLWMEFYHSEQDRHLTVGIGVRARRGRSHLDFWGFAVTDNRRIGQELQLYKPDYSQGEESKIPLDWKALRDLIGTGGQVVQERKEYRKLVNKLLFKYDKVEHFEEMLNLLIQLRSPKLSKDFKPTTIYEILNNGLPPLQEDELRPLAEVLESIDQIGERKKELETHVDWVKRLTGAYDRYNQYRLYQTAGRVAEAEARRSEKHSEIAQKEAELERHREEFTEVSRSLDSDRQQLRQDEAEIQILEQDKALEKARDLKSKQQQKTDLQRELGKANERVQLWTSKQEAVTQKLQANLEQHAQGEAKQRELLEELETLARDAEFRYHDVFHGRFAREIPQEELMFDSWRKGIDEHEAALRKALECAGEHRAAVQAVQARESDVGVAAKRRDEAEAAVAVAEELLEGRKDEQQTAIFKWRKETRVLKPEEEDMTRMLHLLTRFPEVAYEEIKAAALLQYDSLLHAIWVKRAEAETAKKQLVEDVRHKAEELQAWKQQREPEPPRSVSREQTRQTYSERQRTGVPLYAACEFLPHVTEETRAALEAVLQETGLLDAWVGTSGMQWRKEDEEVWIEPNPLDFGYTLADYVKPTPPDDGAVTGEQIDRMLRSIAVGDPALADERAVISEDGRFRMGTLAGKVRPKARAEYIGKESRRQTRLARIAQLEAEIAVLRGKIGEQERILAICLEEETLLKADAAAFPQGTELNAARDLVLSAKEKLKIAAEEVSRKNDLFKAAVQAEGLVRNKFRELTEAWVSLKDESRLRWAVDQFRAYRDSFFELRSVWARFVQLEKAIREGQEELNHAAEQAAGEKEQVDQYNEMLLEVQAVIQAYENALKEMGVEEIYAKLKRLRERVSLLNKQLRELSARKTELEIEIKVNMRELDREREEFTKRVADLQTCTKDWLFEWDLKLVAKWRERAAGEEMGDRVHTCREILQAYKGIFEARKTDSALNGLFNVFTEVRPHLHEYVPEMSEGETGRQMVVFTYDRMNPVTPERLLQDLEIKLVEQNLLLSDKERELLEKVLIQSVGVSIREKIQRASQWVEEMNALMKERNASSGLQLQLKWEPKPKQSETELDTSQLVELLRIDYELLTDEKREQIYTHFQEKINSAKLAAEDQRSLKNVIQEFLDYRDWYRFQLSYKKGEQTSYRELTDSRFNVLSGGEKAMAMYIPLFAAVSSRYKGSSVESPQLVSMDEAFAGVDEENVRDMFKLLTQMGFDYMMTSQVLWGCYDTVPGLAIYEIVRPKDAKYVDVVPYLWNGRERVANLSVLGEDLAV